MRSRTTSESYELKVVAKTLRTDDDYKESYAKCCESLRDRLESQGVLSVLMLTNGIRTSLQLAAFGHKLVALGPT